jgi:hypothetical protein
MELSGYMIKVWWDGHVLRAQGTTKPARVALLGAEHADGELVLPRERIAEVSHKPAGVMTNGRITLRTVEGRRHVLHFRKKSSHEFAELARALGAT